MVTAGSRMNAANREWAAIRAMGHVIAPAASRPLPGWSGYGAGFWQHSGPQHAVSPTDNAGDVADASAASSGVSGEQCGDLLRLSGGS